MVYASPLALWQNRVCKNEYLAKTTIFISVPTYISTTICNEVIKKIYIKINLANPRPRIRLKRLISAKEKGGLNIPILKFYYWATQLGAVVAWVVGDLESGWVSIEETSIPGVPLSSHPFLSQQSKKIIKINNLWIVHTLKIWNLVQKQLRGAVTLSRALPIAGNI